VFFIA
jgi:hypothetical protein